MINSACQGSPLDPAKVGRNLFDLVKARQQPARCHVHTLSELYSVFQFFTAAIYLEYLVLQDSNRVMRVSV